MGRAGRQAVQQLHSCGRSRDYLARRTSGGGVVITGEYLVIFGWPPAVESSPSNELGCQAPPEVDRSRCPCPGRHAVKRAQARSATTPRGDTDLGPTATTERRRASACRIGESIAVVTVPP